ncbi:anthranilate phosphoribosyltransferase [Alkalibacter sp. M17DMB]|nr:anthranilate phosphoribosyltransferase [Alkalibacter mobilis]
MDMREFGALISKLVRKEDLDNTESERAFMSLLQNEQTDMQQGAFLSALTSKGETIEEMAACWKAIYQVDTIKPKELDSIDLVDNSGTGMDTFKTFNISTASSIIASAGGVKMGKHGSRALSSVCGTIDVLEELGIDVEESPELAVASIKNAGIGIFNGMSPLVHPKALGRILSQIAFGTTLNISASLANPALPKYAVRGVYKEEMLEPVAKLMKEIGYKKAMIVYGQVEGSTLGMDEASTLGKTIICELKEDGTLEKYEITLKELGIENGNPEELKPKGDRRKEAIRLIKILNGTDRGCSRDIVSLNSALIFKLTGVVNTIPEGYELSNRLIDEGKAYEKLKEWTTNQSLNGRGMEILTNLEGQAI